MTEESPGDRTRPARRGQGAALAVLGGLCATWLSGLSFPEQNNIWTIPVVLDFAGSAEGPHDPYHASFVRFVSVFWFALRPFVTEANVQAVYVALQLLGNALTALALYALVRRGGGSPVRGGLSVAFLAFAYGLWGATRLGYSELFSTYATHTQYAVVLVLFGLALVAGRRAGAGGVAIGAGALANLFIGVWGALAGGIALILLDRRLARPAQWRFAVGFLLLATPVAWWALASGDGGSPPLGFFRAELGGHIYAAAYPQAAVQHLALGIVATLALLRAPGEALRRLGLATGAAFAVLTLAAAMPYVAELPVLLLLHPLRFVSVTTLLAAGAAATLFVAALDRDDPAALLPPALAVAGYLLKLPVVTLFGFALAARHPGARVAAVAGILATLLWSPIAEVPVKAALSFALLGAVLAAVAWRRGKRDDAVPLLVAVALGAAVSVAPSPVASGALLLAALAAALAAGPVALGAAALSVAASLVAASGEPVRLAAIALGVLLPVAVALLRVTPRWRMLGDGALVALVAALLLAGLARGALAGFAPQPDATRRDWAAAQHWARTHTPPDTLFLPIGVDEGFAMLSRRPVWWEQTQMAAVLWWPRFYPGWRCRRAALAAARNPAARVALARAAGVPYLLVPADTADAYRAGGALPAYRNGHYAILAAGRGAGGAAVCPI